MELSNKTASYNVKKKKNTDLEKYFFNDSFNFLLSVFWENILSESIFLSNRQYSAIGKKSLLKELTAISIQVLLPHSWC